MNSKYKCHNCNSEEPISKLRKITCETGSSKCKYKNYECNSCYSYRDLYKNKKVIIENDLESIQFKDHIRYICFEQFDPNLDSNMDFLYNIYWSICICNECNNNEYEQKIKEIITIHNEGGHDYNDWSSDTLVQKCNDCDFTGTISTLDRITCSKFCGYSAYECDDCGFNKADKKVIIENKLESIQLKDHIKYVVYRSFNKLLLIWICNKCKKDNDVEKIIKNKDNYLQYIDEQTNCISFESKTGRQMWPPIEKDIDSIFED